MGSSSPMLVRMISPIEIIVAGIVRPLPAGGVGVSEAVDGAVGNAGARLSHADSISSGQKPAIRSVMAFGCIGLIWSRVGQES